MKFQKNYGTTVEAMTNNEKKKELWDRQKGESGAVYALFNEYLKLGPLRTIMKLSKKLQNDPKWEEVPTPDALNKKSTTWHWKDRAEAYDTHRIEEERKELEEYNFNRRKERLNQSHVQSRIIHRTMLEYLGTDKEKEDARESGLDLEDLEDKEKNMPPRQKAFFVSELMKGKRIVEESERLDLGDVTERTEQTGKQRHVIEDGKTPKEIKDLFTYSEEGNDKNVD